MENKGLLAVKKISPRTVPDMVIRVIREAIVSGSLPGGTQMKQEEWASQLDISSSALREALKSLAAEGLVKFIPNRGVIVTELSVDEALEIYQIRILLETGALELAIPNLTNQDIEFATKILKKAEDETDNNQWGDLNWKFHEGLYRVACKPKLLGLIKTLYDNVERYMRLYFSDLKYQELAKAEHFNLLQACENKNIEQAKGILRKHISDTSDVVTAYIRQLSNK
ncbi:GntR family transcriptional regulator [Sporomusa sp. KB1]|uniref:GntR family transcriptional regulator n=1 Tax=Sporomusa sp. KB1 TaxID=943346 RepID=UPI0011ACD769|nr:GntR family transcriptional regulator [Sporomusa sp. KB1]TWH47907.1 DNA-binding GntR family transcriptional regulator [Sporomusa sp. KB1]